MSMTRARILVAESCGFTEGAVDVLKEIGELTLADLDRDALLAAVRDVNILWVRLRHRIDAEVMAAAPRLERIVTATTGLNHIDLDEAARRGIRVISLRGEKALLDQIVATAEHTVALTLALLRHLPAATTHVVNGEWDRDRFKGSEIRGKTIGIVGYGRLGRIVARYFATLGATINVVDPAVDGTDVPADVEPVTLRELLTSADVVSLHADLHAGNAGFFGRSEFFGMKRGSWFVNTARGELIDEAALLDALSSGHLAGAALDVLTDEVSGDIGGRALVQYAKSHDNLIITPHIGGCTAESMEKTELFLATRVKDEVSRGAQGVAIEAEITCAE
jgi:D-3-phosphoglycerate dehydrogenase